MAWPVLRPVEPLEPCPPGRGLTYIRVDGTRYCLCVPAEDGQHTRQDLRLTETRRLPDDGPPQLTAEEIAALDAEADRRLGGR